MSNENPLAIADKVVAKQEQAEQRSAARDAEEAVGLDALSDTDALDLLLGAEPAEQIQSVELPARKGTDKPLVLKLRSITEREWDEIRDQSEIRRNRQQRRARGAEETQMDNALMSRLLVKKATINLDWNDSKLRTKFGVQTGEDVIRKLLLYGEIANLAGVVMEISGFDDDLIRFVGNE